MFYVFHGNDEFTIHETVARLRDRLAASDPLAELNATALDGRSLTLGELRGTADALPFMGQRRLVIVTGLLERCNPRSGKREERGALVEALKSYLPNVPPTTRLVFIDGPLAANNPVLRWVGKWLGDQPSPQDAAVVREFPSPGAGRLPSWLAARARAAGGAIEPGAAAALTDALTRDGAVDLRLVAGELEKLMTFAGQRAVTADDVARLVTPVSLESIFRLVDALAERNGPRAATLLHQFLESGEPPLRLLALIARQFRLLAQTRALLDADVPPAQMGGRLPVPPFVVRKLTGQARRFTMPGLEAALRRLLEIDTAIKTGRIEPALALDLFVAAVCGARPNASDARSDPGLRSSRA